MSQSLPPTVFLDGSAVRRVREEKKLTQLYVAKVVGVTTDTISRWENNRYPSVKRENALRLAEALEVPVEEIVQREADEVVSPPPSDASRRIFLRAVPAFLVLAVLAGFYLYFQYRSIPQETLKAERILPGFAAPESVTPVQVLLESAAETKGFILREHFPRGWKLIEASPPASSLDNEEGTARWIVKPGEVRHRISYLLKVDPEAKAGEEGVFAGDIVANPDGRPAPAPVSGATVIRIAPYHWADLNGDKVIDDAEMLQASDTVDKMKGVHLDWYQLEELWDAGGYRWDQERGKFVPSRPVHPLPPS
jgi:transcriptional regulator with XRE-family HTH domain